MTSLQACDQCGKTEPAKAEDVEFRWLKIQDWAGLLRWEVCSVACGSEIFAGAITERFAEIEADAAAQSDEAVATG